MAHVTLWRDLGRLETPREIDRLPLIVAADTDEHVVVGGAAEYHTHSGGRHVTAEERIGVKWQTGQARRVVNDAGAGSLCKKEHVLRRRAEGHNPITIGIVAELQHGRAHGQREARRQIDRHAVEATVATM